MTADDDVEALKHAGLIVLAVGVEAFDHQGHISQKFGFVFVGLQGGEFRKIRKGGGLSLNDIVVLFDVLQQHLGIARF